MLTDSDAIKVARLIERRLDISGSYRALARELGVSAAYLNGVVLGKMAPGEKLLTALGLRRQTRYVPLASKE